MLFLFIFKAFCGSIHLLKITNFEGKSYAQIKIENGKPIENKVFLKQSNFEFEGPWEDKRFFELPEGSYINVVYDFEFPTPKKDKFYCFSAYFKNEGLKFSKSAYFRPDGKWEFKYNSTEPIDVERIKAEIKENSDKSSITTVVSDTFDALSLNVAIVIAIVVVILLVIISKVCC